MLTRLLYCRPAGRKHLVFDVQTCHPTSGVSGYCPSDHDWSTKSNKALAKADSHERTNRKTLSTYPGSASQMRGTSDLRPAIIVAFSFGRKYQGTSSERSMYLNKVILRSNCKVRLTEHRCCCRRSAHVQDVKSSLKSQTSWNAIIDSLAQTFRAAYVLARCYLKAWCVILRGFDVKAELTISSRPCKSCRKRVLGLVCSIVFER